MKATDKRNDRTIGADELFGGLQDESKKLPVVFDGDGVAPTDYLLQAKIDSALERWAHHCPPMLVNSDWSHADISPCFDQINKVLCWQFGSPKGLLLTGETGRGKTRSMMALWRRLAGEGHDVFYFHASDWFAQLRKQVNYGRDEADGWVKAVAKRPLLYIDDLGQEAVASIHDEWAQGWFFRLLDLRVGYGHPLFVTTNLNAAQIASNQGDVRGDPLIRRLLDLCEPVKFQTK